MPRTRTAIIGFLTLTSLVAGIAPDRGNLLVDNGGKLLLIGTDGTQRVLAGFATT